MADKKVHTPLEREEKSANRGEKWVMDFITYHDKISGTKFLSSKKCY